MTTKTDIIAAMQPASLFLQTMRAPKVCATPETAMFTRRWQNRSKYLGDGSLRPEPVLSETDKARLALIKQNPELISGDANA